MIRLPLPFEHTLLTPSDLNMGFRRPGPVREMVHTLLDLIDERRGRLALQLAVTAIWLAMVYAWGYCAGAAAGWQDGCTFGAVAERNLPHHRAQAAALVKEEW